MMKRLTFKTLPSCLTNFHPGVLFKQFLVGWYSKIKTDYRYLAHSFNNKVQNYAGAYYDWMERFIEMDYEEGYYGPPLAVAIPGNFVVKGIFNNYSEKISHRFGYPVVEIKNALAGKFEKALIGIYRLFTPNPILEIPALEIINAGTIGGEAQAIKKPFNKKWPLKWFFQTKYSSDKMACDDQSFAGNQPTDKYPKLLRWPEIFRKTNSIQILKNLRRGVISVNTLLTESFSVLPLIPEYNFPANIGSGFM